MPWPGFRHFPEVNLRYYVRHGDQRGVAFVRELVPQRFVVWLARTLYNERYYPARMHNTRDETPERLTMTYHFAWNGRAQTVRVTGTKPPVLPPTDSTEHFFKEHQWGFGTSRRFPNLPKGVRSIRSCLYSGVANRAAVMGVSMVPGWTELALIPSAAYWMNLR